MMSDRVHACLDGELSRDALSPEELASLRLLESAIGDVALSVRATPAPDLVARVMQALPAPTAAPAPAPRTSAWSRAAAWLWQPRSFHFQLRPAYGMAGLAMAALGAVLLPGAEQPTLAPVMVAEAPAAGGSARLYVQFRLEAPDARNVAVAGSFTNWQPEHQLREVAPGVWSALVPLEPGVHDYTFVVDGEEWVPDPYAPHVDDSFGGTNSRLFLPVPAQST